jgi:hypothetical protein
VSGASRRRCDLLSEGKSTNAFFTPRFHFHVDEGTSSSDLDTLTGFATGRRINMLVITAFTFYRWWPWFFDEHRTTGATRSSVASFPLDLFIMI